MLHLPKPDPLSASTLPDRFDVLIVGGGAAGLYAALCLPEHFQVGLITKDAISLSASDWAQGGMAAAIDPKDSVDSHIADTLKAGAELCEREAVSFLVEHASQCVKALVEMGVAFDRRGTELALTLEAAHSHRRVLHAADTTGRAVVTTLTAQVVSRKNIQVIPQAFALGLWLNSQTRRCQGISLVYQEQVVWVRAGAVLMATGGGGQVFAQTTNPELSTGDGVAIAWRAGAVLRDLEFVQFHPTALTQPGAPRFLISEAVRGEGAHLVDDQGHRFVFNYHPAGELAPRDIVSRAIFNHLQETAADPATAHVWLDMRPISPETIRQRFPNIIQVCRQWGVDVFREPIPIAPAAHYWMGGIVTDLMNRTSIPGLYALGETASTGVHGANRLASNSLLECLVFGAQMKQLELSQDDVDDVEDMDTSNPSMLVVEQANQAVKHWQAQQTKIEALRFELPRLMWQSAGICREQRSLEEAIAQVETWQQELASLPLSKFLSDLKPGSTVPVNILNADQQLRVWGETRNLLDISSLILKSAAFRTESRGGHYRIDYPQPDDNWKSHTQLQNKHLWRSAPVQT